MSDRSDPPGVPYGTAFDDIDLRQVMSYWGHGAWLGMRFHAKGDDWVELALPWNPDITVDRDTGVLASGPIISLLDNATGMSVWQRRGVMAPQVTVDLRVDYMRASKPGKTVIGRAHCYKATRAIAFVRGIAYDETPDDPVANVTGTFILVPGNRA
jgi:uncharacterized protein (TIGR00369 family)